MATHFSDIVYKKWSQYYSLKTRFGIENIEGVFVKSVSDGLPCKNLASP